MSKDYGKATYVPGRSRKNPVLIYTCRQDRSKVYEFMISVKFKTPGLVSWKCMSCTKIKNGYRNLHAELKRKVPLILVDNDIIKEDPEKPLNAEHFCNGKEAVEAVLSRARMEFVHRHGNEDTSNLQIKDTIHSFAREAVSTTPIPLSLKQKREVEKTLDAGCLPLLHGVKMRRRHKQRKIGDSTKEVAKEQSGEPVQETSTSAQRTEEQGKPSESRNDVGSPVKRVQRISRQPPTAVMVRPLPPYYCPPGPSQPQLQPRYHPQILHEQHDQHSHQGHPPIEYYVEEDVTIVDQDHHNDPHHVHETYHNFEDVELILADEQDVAYDIELR